VGQLYKQLYNSISQASSALGILLFVLFIAWLSGATTGYNNLPMLMMSPLDLMASMISGASHLFSNQQGKDGNNKQQGGGEAGKGEEE